MALFASLAVAALTLSPLLGGSLDPKEIGIEVPTDLVVPDVASILLSLENQMQSELARSAIQIDGLKAFREPVDLVVPDLDSILSSLEQGMLDELDRIAEALAEPEALGE